MQRESGYYAKFPPEVLQAATQALDARMPNHTLAAGPGHRTVALPGESWTYDNDAQFYQAYRDSRCSSAAYRLYGHKEGTLLVVIFEGDTTWVTVGAPTEATIAEVFEIFEGAVDKYRIPRPKPEASSKASPKIFIGHGGKNREWMDLQSHLRDQHHYQAEAFESGARAGHTIRDILDTMVDKATFAILVFSAEDEMADGSKRPRENVVHETGLFQGRLGFHRAIVLLEKGVEPFSNLDGIQYISFSKGNIKETYGDVLATLRREFGDAR